MSRDKIWKFAEGKSIISYYYIRIYCVVSVWEIIIYGVIYDSASYENGSTSIIFSL